MNLKIKTKLQRISCNFDKELDEIRKIRFSSVDSDLQRPLGRERITEGIIKMPEWRIIKERLTKENRIDKLR
jgi:hypothetical protein